MNVDRLPKILFFSIALLLCCNFTIGYSLKEEVKKGPLKENKPKSITLSSKGVFESSALQEVKILPKYWKSFKVKKASKIGAYVKEGDVLVEFDMEKLDEQIVSLKKTGYEDS